MKRTMKVTVLRTKEGHEAVLSSKMSIAEAIIFLNENFPGETLESCLTENRTYKMEDSEFILHGEVVK